MTVTPGTGRRPSRSHRGPTNATSVRPRACRTGTMPSEARVVALKIAVGRAVSISAFAASAAAWLVAAEDATKSSLTSIPAASNASWYPRSRAAEVAIELVSPIYATLRWPWPIRWVTASKAACRSSMSMRSATAPGTPRSTRTTGVGALRSHELSWPSRARRAARQPAAVPSAGSPPAPARDRAACWPRGRIARGEPSRPRRCR